MRVEKIEGNEIVEYCWRMETFLEPVEYRVLPSPFVDIIFPLEGSVFIDSLRKNQKSPFFVPLLDQHKQVRISARARLIGIRLRPVYANLLLKPNHMLIKNANEASEVMEPFIYRSLLELIRSDQHLDSLTLAVGQLIHYSICLSEAGFDFLFDNSYENYLNRDLGTQHIAQDMNVSLRWLEKTYRRQIDMTPKSFQKLVRFNTFIHAYLARPESPLSCLSQQCGYYDQSHLVKEVKRFSGLAPTRLRKYLSVAHREMNHC